LIIGQTISHYKILDKLGEGGMGVVYKAEDTKLKRTVALKFLPPDLTRDPEAKERFIHEAQAASALDHPSICTVYEINESDDGQMFIAMACYEGETLKKKIERGPLKIDEAIDLATQVAQGLARAHEAGIVHRDMKPANIMVTDRGEAKIVDFGLAKLVGQTRLTKTGATMGTAAYMSPEQAQSEAVDSRTDIWSLGVVLYEMLTGKRPFESDYEQALVYSILNEDPKPMCEWRAEIPEALEEIVRRAMAKRLEDRYQSAAEFLSDLSSYRIGTDLSAQTRRVSTRRRRGIYAVLGAAIIVIVTLLVVVFSGKGEVINTMAVLPFTNVSKDPNLEWMCDGLTNEVIGDLCRTPGFSKVIAFSSVMEFKNKEVTPEEVRRKLGVVAVLVSRLYQHGDEVSVTTELLDAKKQTRLWGNEYSHKASEIRALPREIVSAVTKALNLVGSDTTQSTVIQHSTTNPDAYRLFLQGQMSYHKVTKEALYRSIALYRSALELDPNMGSAYAGISSAYCQLGNQNYIPWAQAADSARIAAQRALSLNRNLADAHFVLGMIRYNDYERIAAEEEFKLALRLNPLNADCIHIYAHLLSDDGRHDDGIRLMKQSIELEPLSAHYQYCLGTLLLQARHYDEAILEYQKVFGLDSTFFRAYKYLSRSYELKGLYDKAIDALHRYVQKDPDDRTGEQLILGRIYASMGRKDDVRKCIRQLHQLAESAPVDPGDIALLYARLGEKDSAFVYLDKAYRDHSNQIYFIKVDPDLDSLRSDRRYRELLQKMGFSE
jgi:serine/threonine protein kinase/tetratricopeptide (TPR) repeat protein